MPIMDDSYFMQRALELAEFGRGLVSPNPMVGCVIVCDGQIIGEGWHQHYGGPHAEVNAIKAVVNQELLSRSTCYVTLEPCSHLGQTPPCADLLIEKGLSKVVIGCLDSNPLVGGKGVAKLKSAGIEMQQGVLEADCQRLNRTFFTFIEKKRPYIILKWAQTNDGFIARDNYDSKWISNIESRTLVHQWRAEEDAILVGKNTAKYDNPTLNVRLWEGKNPLRIVLDKGLELESTLNLFDQSQDTLVYNTLKDARVKNLEHVMLRKENFLETMLADLYKRKVQSLLVEGGAAVLKSFMNLGLWDEARVFTSKKEFGKGIKAPVIRVMSEQVKEINGDELKIYYNG